VRFSLANGARCPYQPTTLVMRRTVMGTPSHPATIARGSKEVAKGFLHQHLTILLWIRVA
jgi:hypothetical protein